MLDDGNLTQRGLAVWQCIKKDMYATVLGNGDGMMRNIDLIREVTKLAANRWPDVLPMVGIDVPQPTCASGMSCLWRA